MASRYIADYKLILILLPLMLRIIALLLTKGYERIIVDVGQIVACQSQNFPDANSKGPYVRLVSVYRTVTAYTFRCVPKSQ